MMRVAAVGEIAEDHYLDDGERLLGGISANFARAAAFAGAQASLFSAVGDDARGARLCAALDATPVESHVRVLPGRSARQRIRMGDGGERVFSGFDPGVLPGYRLHGDELALVSRCDVVAVPCSPESEAVFTQCLSSLSGAPSIVADFSQESLDDPARAVKEVGPQLTIAFVGGSAALLPSLQALSRRTQTIVVLTAGAGGAFALSRGECLHQPSLAGTVVDTTGCGDAFQAGFCVRYFAGGDLAAALVAGAELAARVAARRGADPSRPAPPGKAHFAGRVQKPP